MLHSNTFLLSLRGWRGLCVDAAPVGDAFRRLRPRDAFVACGVDEQAGERDFFVFAEPEYSTFSTSARDGLLARGSPRLMETRRTRVAPLRDLVRETLGDARVDVLSVDVEGFELEVLRSWDWRSARPRIVVVETRADGEAALASPPVRFLLDQGYRWQAKTLASLLFIDGFTNPDPG